MVSNGPESRHLIPRLIAGKPALQNRSQPMFTGFSAFAVVAMGLNPRIDFPLGIAVPMAVVVMGVLVGAFCDLRGFRLPNWLTIGMLCSGLAWHSWYSGGPGFLRSGAGILISALPLMLLYARGAMGAGDVKLMSGIGAWMGAWFGLHVIIVAGVVGGGAGVIRAVLGKRSSHRELRELTIEQVAQRADRRRYLLPFGLMILCGVLVNLIFPGIQQLAR